MLKFLAAVIIFLQTTCAAAEIKKPVRIVCLPIIFQNEIDSETRSGLELKISRAVHIPLNGSLKLAEYLDAEISVAALEKNPADAVKNLAEELDADLVICPILRRYSQSYLPAFGLSGESRLASSADAELIVYDRRTDTLTDKKTSRSYSGSYSKFGTAPHLAGECFDALIKKTGLREIIRAIR
ncbi:MAG: hypothetical protein J5809_02195 [Selenomonadaceae bacterium]|nr:hypothetical protein [Selenomonadaceae bacterium]